MSLTDARSEAAAMRATFSFALEESAEACEKVAEVLRQGARGDASAEDVSATIRALTAALDATRDATMTWAAMEAMLREVER